MDEKKKSAWAMAIAITSAGLFAGCYFINPLAKNYDTPVMLMVIGGTVLMLVVEMLTPRKTNRAFNYLLKSFIMFIMTALYFFW